MWKFLLALVTVGLPLGALAASLSPEDAAHIQRILRQTPLIDGHNDLPWEIHERFGGKLSALDLSGNSALYPHPPDAPPLMTDIPRLRRGQLGGQFWSVWVPPTLHEAVAVQATLEQIDLVHRMVARYPRDFELATTAADIRRIHDHGRIAALIGIEGGHQINNSLPALREFYALGARYMTLTHTSNTDWADSATDDPKHGGLTPFGREVVREMNRLGMLVDLSHVSPATMRAALDVTAAPVIFSHSSARALVDHPRNVPDDILRLVAANGGVVMVNFFPGYVSESRNRWLADLAAEKTRYNSPPYSGLYIGQPERAKAALEEWQQSHPAPAVTIADIADHIVHIREVAGIDHVGIGSDFDGIDATAQGLEGVDQYPNLLAELVHRGWTDEELRKLAGENILRVLAACEQVARRLTAERAPSEATIAELDRPRGSASR